MITIGIVLYNEEKHMPLLLRNLHVLRSFSSQISLVIVDNASTDTTSTLLKLYQEQFSFVLLKRTENNLGEARQDVVRHAQNEWVGFIDGDCGISEHWVRTILDLAPTVPANTAAFGGPWVPAGLWQSYYRSLFRSPMGNFSLPQLSLGQKAIDVFHIPTANVIYRKRDVLRAGGFRANFAFVGEDLDLSCRLRQQGQKLVMYSQIPIDHYLPHSFKQWSRKIFFYGRGRVHVASQNKQWSDRILILPLVFLAIMLASVVVGEMRVLAAYVVATFVVSAMFAPPSAWLNVWMLAVSTHFSYALGMAYEWTLQFPKIFCKSRRRGLHLKTAPAEGKNADFEAAVVVPVSNTSANAFDEAF